MHGYIALHRSIMDWRWYQDANTCRVFIHLLMTANHAEGEWRGVTIRRGQTVTSRRSLSRTLGISESAVRLALRRLISTGEITVQTNSRYSIITLSKYDEYQIPSAKAKDRQTGTKPEAIPEQTGGNAQNPAQSNSAQIKACSPANAARPPADDPPKTHQRPTNDPLTTTNNKDNKGKKKKKDKHTPGAGAAPSSQTPGEILPADTRPGSPVRQKPGKTSYGEFVSMTRDEYQALVNLFGATKVQGCIDILNSYKGSTGRQYESDYWAIQSWATRRYDEYQARGQPVSSIHFEYEREYTEEELNARVDLGWWDCRPDQPHPAAPPPIDPKEEV